MWKGTVPVLDFFDATEECARINELELLAALNSQRYIVSFPRNFSILLVSDSLVKTYIVHNIASGSPRLLRPLRELITLCEH